MSDSTGKLASMLAVQELVDHYRGSEARRLILRFKALELALSTFRGNCDQWRQVVQAPRPSAAPKRTPPPLSEDDAAEKHSADVHRALHNCLAAAMTLADTTRVLYRELYEQAGSMPAYHSQIKAHFSDSALSQFMRDVRLYCCHARLPLLPTRPVAPGPPDGATAIPQAPVDARELLIFRGWATRARQFIDKSGPVVDLHAAVEKYRETIDLFHGWFEVERYRIHKAEFDYLNSLRRRIREIQAAETSTHGDEPPTMADLEELAARVRPSPPRHPEIQVCAYYIWLAENRPEGRANLHWDRAQARLRNRAMVKNQTRQPNS